MSDDSDGTGEVGCEEAIRHEEVVRARGHDNVAGTHASTFEVTTDDYLTPAGDCIVGVEADRAPADFDEAFVAACRDPDARIVTVLSVGGGAGAEDGQRATTDGSDAPAEDRDTVSEGSDPAVEGSDPDSDGVQQRIVGRGDPALSFENGRSAVWRRSEYVDDRTVAVEADHAAADLDRALVDALAGGATLTVRIAVEVPA